MLEQINVDLFLLINAPTNAQHAWIQFATFCAEYLIFLPVIFIVLSWFIWPSSRELILKMVLTICVTLLFAAILRYGIAHPRPFVLPLGTNFLPHSPSHSLPSKHGAFMFAVAMTLFFYKPKEKQLHAIFLTFSALLVACLVSWSRIYLGVHWPLDMIIALLLSGICAISVNKKWHYVTASFHHMVKYYRALVNF